MKKQEQHRFIGIIKAGSGFLIKQMPEKVVDQAPSKIFSKTRKGIRLKVWIIKLKGKVHKNAGTIADLPKKYQGIISSALQEGVSSVYL